MSEEERRVEKEASWRRRVGKKWEQAAREELVRLAVEGRCPVDLIARHHHLTRSVLGELEHVLLGCVLVEIVGRRKYEVAAFFYNVHHLLDFVSDFAAEGFIYPVFAICYYPYPLQYRIYQLRYAVHLRGTHSVFCDNRRA